MPDDVLIPKRPRFASLETTEHTDNNVTTKIHIVRIEIKRLGWLSLGLVAIGFVLGALVL